jgi:peptide/nickel transport system ATP-binding protein/oligopeptide transport system ATP-binding protein
MMTEPTPLLAVEHLRTHFFTFEGIAKAVDDVSFSVRRGEVLGLVGESGCGKSVTAQSIMRLVPEPPGRIVGGSIRFDGRDLAKISPPDIRDIRGNRISMIFQEPMTSLNPVFTVGDQIMEMYTQHRKMGAREAMDRAVDMLRRVQIPAPERRVSEYPHQLSGGMRQRAMIAMALACDPEILIADEPTTALDVTIQAQIIDLILQLIRDFGTAVILITHDLGVISETADRVIVMYAGRIVEEAPTIELFQRPAHPYTQGLLKSIPKLGDRAKGGDRMLSEIRGIVPGLMDLPPGCAFEPRCGFAEPRCRRQMPDLMTLDATHRVRCVRYESEANT